ncbi:MAG: redoxin domain-containing protein, partial [Acidobacteria bacterium]|nr:redoxin domain-containing protein [Acidobacteriota bacterium]
METLLLIARLLLALVFALAGAGKLADAEGSRKAMKSFGVADALVPLFASLLPWIELAIAVALLPLATAWFGAVGALLLLLAFTIGIAVNLAKGNAPDCHCFGQLHSEPVSWRVVARNVALASVATFIFAQGAQGNAGASAFDWLGAMRPVEAISLFVSLITAGLLIVALQKLRALSATVTAMNKLVEEDYAAPETVERNEAAPPAEGLPVGAPAPAFTLATLKGEQVSLSDLLAHGKAVMLLFVSPNCSPCKALLPFLRSWQRDYGEQLTIAVISRGTPD